MLIIQVFAALLMIASSLPVARAEVFAPAPDAKAPAPAYEVVGFRSARFGMTEDEVRKMIVKDFGVKPDAIKAEEHPNERTRLLTVKISDLLPKGGVSHAVYVFGYTSKKLIQINVVWSKDTDHTLKTEMLVGNANLLRAYFEGFGFKPESVITNGMLSNGEGLIVFKGTDAQKRTVLLMLVGTTETRKGTAGKGETKEFTPSALRLSYIADPDNPDVFRLAPGQF